MATAAATIQKRLPAGLCSVTLEAQETPERKLDCRISGEIVVRTPNGNAVSPEQLQVLCGSGLALARRKLKLKAGLSAIISSISGVLAPDDETGVCIATAVAVAKALGKPDLLLQQSLNGWEIVAEQAASAG
ncbi:MAG TPA: hypothetical protein VGZ47_03335 [Gemmataceae bacterium]|jgi:hypothetical protein|nr:hypothetical protein [Gemmataceae bacterium]